MVQHPKNGLVVFSDCRLTRMQTVICLRALASAFEEQAERDGLWTVLVLDGQLVVLNEQDPVNSRRWHDEEEGWQPWDLSEEFPK